MAFPVGVGPDSPSRDATNLLSRDSAGELRRGGGLVGCRWCPPGAALPERQFDAFWEEMADGNVAERLVGKLGRRRARGVLNPCARESKA